MADGTCEPASRPTEDTCSSNVVTRDLAGDGRSGAGGAGAGAGAGADATPGSAPKPAMPVFPYKDAEQSVEVRPHERPGRRIRVVRIRREGGAGTVFFVHGSCATYRQFEPQMWHAQHATSYNLVAFDAHGCGSLAAQAPNEWESYHEDEYFADLLAAFTRYSTPGKRNVVVAHSFGCVLASRLAAHASCKDQVAGVVLVGAAYDQPPGTMHPVFRLPVTVLNWLRARMGAAFVANAFASGTDTVEYRRGGVWGDVFSPCATTVRGCQALIEAECKKTEDNEMHMVKAFYRQMQWRCHDALPAIKVPVLLITGAEDKITPVVQAEKVRSVLQQGTLSVVDGGGHQVMAEQPAKVNAALFKFCGDVLSTP